jgi:4-hydroxymandelate oxidase
LVVGAFAADRAFHAEGLLPVAAVCQRLSLPLMVSEETVTPLANLTAAHDACWLQLRAAGKLDRARTLLDQASSSGVRAIVLTVLAPVHPRPGSRPGGFDVGGELQRRGWSTIGAATSAGIASLPAFPQWSWDDVRAIVDHGRAVGLPILLKGLLHPDDVVLAAATGAAGAIASNVGLRQLGRWALPLHQLEGMRARSDMPLMLDGGVRHGVDAVVARCLGATMAIAARPIVTALVAGGPTGVEAMLRGWLDEVASATSWLGAASLADLNSSFLSTEPA